MILDDRRNFRRDGRFAGKFIGRLLRPLEQEKLFGIGGPASGQQQGCRTGKSQGPENMSQSIVSLQAVHGSATRAGASSDAIRLWDRPLLAPADAARTAVMQSSHPAHG
jgi:hypothetical protein